MVFTGIVETFWEDTGNKNLITAANVNEDYYIFTHPETYTEWARNRHHWTTGYVWENVIPKIIGEFGLPFDTKSYDYITNIVNNEYGTFDVSYHRFNKPQCIDFSNLSTNENKCLDMYSIKCNIQEYYECTEYHSLFRGFHSVCVMENTTSLTNRVLIVNCDSMSIPIIPILIPFYRRILILDNRTSKSFRTIIKNFMQYENCDVIELFHAECWNHNKRFENLK